MSTARGKKKTKTRKRKGKGLAGIDAIMPPSTKAGQGGALGMDQIGIAMLAVVGGNIAGKVIFDKHVLIPSAILGAIALASKNVYCAAASAGLLVAAALPSDEAKGVSGANDEGVEGFDLAAFVDKAKGRAKDYFLNFAEKLYLPKPETNSAAPAATTSGLNGGDDKVNYFLSPQGTGEIDMSDLDKLHAAVRQMNTQVSGTDDEVSERNF